MYFLKNALAVYADKTLFEEIHKAKSAFLRVLERVSSRIDHSDLYKAHRLHKGVKISKGNELERCPYQVLDIIRDFDPESGINIRLLHWWGYGLFVFILVGKDFFNSEDTAKFLNDERLSGFVVNESSTPFSYKLIVEDYMTKKNRKTGFGKVGGELGRFQLVKQLNYGANFQEIEEDLFAEIANVFLVLHGFVRD